MLDVSIVVPVYNELSNLPALHEQLTQVLRALSRSYECVYVDDGSSDGTTAVLEKLADTDPHIRPIYLKRNFGQTAALSAGFDHAAGRIIVTLDADLQNDPLDIPMMIEKLEEGYDLVTGWRKDRKDSFIRNFPSHMANAIIAKVTGVNIHDSGCTLKAYRREVVQDLRLYGDMHRFIPALASWQGIKILEVPVRHHARKHGKSKYNLSRTFRVVLDLITVKFLLSYSGSPIQMFGKLGWMCSFMGWICFAGAIILKVLQERTLTGNPLFYLFILLQIATIQFISIGLIAEMNMRIYHESQRKKTYLIKGRTSGALGGTTSERA